MNMQMRNKIRSFLDIEPQERLKLFFLATAFFFVIAGYTVASELKDAIFLNVVGRAWIPYAKSISMIVLLPAIFVYSLLVDRVRRYQLLAIYSALYGIFSLLIAYYLGHPEIGIVNTAISPYRFFGWFTYFFFEGYSPFVVGVFWAFANSINSPDSAKKNYGLMVSGSKLGGILSATIAWGIFSWFSCAQSLQADVFAHQIVLAISAFAVLIVPFVIYFLVKKVPHQYLHGYEAAYQVEKKKHERKTGVLEGFMMLVKYPYVMGIFCMVYFYEVIATVLSYLRLGVAEQYCNMSSKSAFLFKVSLTTHIIGLVISLIGTRSLLLFLGTRICLLLIPLLSGALLFYAMLSGHSQAIIFAFISLKAVNYAFSWPVRESLYIPTVKDIKFKAKSWIDAFGSKLAKASGSGVNVAMSSLGSEVFLAIHSFFFAVIVAFWFVTAFLLGHRFEKAVSKDEVIGA